MLLTSRVHLVNPGLTIFNMIDRESQAMAEALRVNAASDLLVRLFLAVLDAWGRSDVKVFLRADQEMTVTLIIREVQARRRPNTLLERSPVVSHATMERAPSKHATETRVGGMTRITHLSTGWCDVVGSFAGITC